MRQATSRHCQKVGMARQLPRLIYLLIAEQRPVAVSRSSAATIHGHFSQRPHDRSPQRRNWPFRLLANLVAHRLELQPVIEPAVGLSASLLREAVLSLVIVKPDPIAGAKQFVDRQYCFDEWPARITVGAVTAQDQERSRRH